MTEKERLRKKVLFQRNSFSGRQEASEKITAAVVACPSFQMAEWVFAYVAIGTEVTVNALIEYAWRQRKRVAVPVTVPERKDMFFAEITSWNELSCCQFGLWEPKRKVQERYPEGNTFFLVPGVAFDRRKNRLGYGAGYYDRYFAKYTECYKRGIAFSCQLVETVYPQAHDCKMNEIITESEVIGGVL